MIYAKDALCLEDQADLLLKRGLVANRDELVLRLKVVNYYRLSGYLYPYRLQDAAGKATDNFISGTKFDIVWRRYNFDRRLRIILLDAIERIEVSVRTRLVFHFVMMYGPFGHLDEKNLPGFKKSGFWKKCWRNIKSLACLKGITRSDHAQWLGKMNREKNRARGEVFVKHFVETYGDRHDTLPLWMAGELMSCDSLLQFAHAVEQTLLKQAAADFGFPDERLFSWSKAIFSLRNTCAHHARVWNRVFGIKPSIPGKNKNPDWHVLPGFAPDRIGLMLTVCYVWLGKVSSTTKWRERLFELFDEYPEIPLVEIGLPADWRNHPLWK
ncbi:MAG TPA: Abi family protein [Verrucomicrobiae bacterium]|jgi:abortive infection bacteriophage resistance protein